MKNLNKVSVYIPTHNRLALLKRALHSVQNQTYENIEIVVVDDGSTDGTTEFLKNASSQDSRVKYIRHDKPKGANAARNTAILNATGEYITGLDDDDEMMPNRIEEFLKNYDPKYAFICARSIQVDNNGNFIAYYPESCFETITLDEMLYANIAGNQIFTTRQKMMDYGLFDEKLLASQEYDLWLRMLRDNPVAKQICEPLSKIYKHDNRISTSSKKTKGYLQCYTKHKKIMNKRQRQRRLTLIRSFKNKWPPDTFKTTMVMLPERSWPRYFLKLFVKKLKGLLK